MRNRVLKSSSYIEQRMNDFIIVANFVIGVQIDAPQLAYPPTPLLRLPVCLYVWCLYVCWEFTDTAFTSCSQSTFYCCTIHSKPTVIVFVFVTCNSKHGRWLLILISLAIFFSTQWINLWNAIDVHKPCFYRCWFTSFVHKSNLEAIQTRPTILTKTI